MVRCEFNWNIKLYWSFSGDGETLQVYSLWTDSNMWYSAKPLCVCFLPPLTPLLSLGRSNVVPITTRELFQLCSFARPVCASECVCYTVWSPDRTHTATHTDAQTIPSDMLEERTLKCEQLWWPVVVVCETLHPLQAFSRSYRLLVP